MKLVRFGVGGEERPGLLDGNGDVRDLSGVVDDITPATLSDTRLGELARLTPEDLALVSPRPRFGPPVAGIGKLVCIGLNYRDHAAESGLPVPAEPIVFMKALSSLGGPDDDVLIPRGAEKVDWEVELGVVIGKRASYVGEADALDHVAGYTVVNDVSERAYQMERGGQWTKGKSFDTFAPVGPWLVTKDEVPDPQKLRLWLTVNGEHRQDGNTGSMIFGVAKLVSYLSEFMTLLPGDVICSGTSAGVGMGMKPPAYIREGDVMRLGVDGLGEQQQRAVAWGTGRAGGLDRHTAA